MDGEVSSLAEEEVYQLHLGIHHRQYLNPEQPKMEIKTSMTVAVDYPRRDRIVNQ